MKFIISWILDVILASFFMLAAWFMITYNLGELGDGIKENFYKNIKEYAKIIECGLLFLYFIITTIFFGNTFGRKLMRIKERYGDFGSSKPLHRTPYKFPAGNLRKTEILTVTPVNGYWTCPSCKEINKECWELCENCGQEVEKYIDKELVTEIRNKLQSDQIVLTETRKRLKIAFSKEVLIRVILILGIIFLSVSILKSCGFLKNSEGRRSYRRY